MKHLLEKDSNYSANPLLLSVLSKEKNREEKENPYRFKQIFTAKES
ncbi:hypothetical protein [Bacillus arachidis]|nr:hypothetical protein [Bacillus arachidis]WIY63198.1 hypothetical protein QRY57_12390 [Bacillus arachidis]